MNWFALACRKTGLLVRYTWQAIVPEAGSLPRPHPSDSRHDDGRVIVRRTVIEEVEWPRTPPPDPCATERTSL